MPLPPWLLPRAEQGYEGQLLLSMHRVWMSEALKFYQFVPVINWLDAVTQNISVELSIAQVEVATRGAGDRIIRPTVTLTPTADVTAEGWLQSVDQFSAGQEEVTQAAASFQPTDLLLPTVDPYADPLAYIELNIGVEGDENPITLAFGGRALNVTAEMSQWTPIIGAERQQTQIVSFSTTVTQANVAPESFPYCAVAQTVVPVNAEQTRWVPSRVEIGGTFSDFLQICAARMSAYEDSERERDAQVWRQFDESMRQIGELASMAAESAEQEARKRAAENRFRGSLPGQKRMMLVYGMAVGMLLNLQRARNEAAQRYRDVLQRMQPILEWITRRKPESVLEQQPAERMDYSPEIASPRGAKRAIREEGEEEEDEVQIYTDDEENPDFLDF
jgi:hypothetical protein